MLLFFFFCFFFFFWGGGRGGGGHMIFWHLFKRVCRRIQLGLKFGWSLHLHLYCFYASSVGSGEWPKPPMFDKAIRTEFHVLLQSLEC